MIYKSYTSVDITSFPKVVVPTYTSLRTAWKFQWPHPGPHLIVPVFLIGGFSPLNMSTSHNTLKYIPHKLRKLAALQLPFFFLPQTFKPIKYKLSLYYKTLIYILFSHYKFICAFSVQLYYQDKNPSKWQLQNYDSIDIIH